MNLSRAIDSLLKKSRSVQDNSTQNKTRTCKYFLRKKCRYTDEECHYSHTVIRKEVLCRFYKAGTCRYQERCGFMHPPHCEAFLENKNDRPNGCFKSNCEFFHPTLCYNVERQGDCLNKKCRFFHRPKGYYQGKKWTAEKIKESQAKHEAASSYTNEKTPWVTAGARPRKNNQPTSPQPESRPDSLQVRTEDQRLVEYRSSYASKTKIGINGENEKDFLLKDMEKVLRRVQNLWGSSQD